MSKRNKIEDIKFFVSKLMNEQQREYAALVSALGSAIGKTRECDEAVKVLTQVYEAKLDLLELIYKEIQRS